MGYLKKLGRWVLSIGVMVSLVGCIQNNAGVGQGGTGGGTGGTGGIAGTGGSGGGDCVPDAMFTADDGCNQCQCPESGLRAEASCTERACGNLCEPGSQFQADDGCNTCICPENGVRAEAACTDRACRVVCEGIACGGACDPVGERPSADGAPGNGDEPANGAEFVAEPSPYACNQAGECMRGFSADQCEAVSPCGGSACGDICDPQTESNTDDARAEDAGAGAAGGAGGAGDDQGNWGGGGGGGGSAADEVQRMYMCDAALNCVPANAENIQCGGPCDNRDCGDPCASLGGFDRLQAQPGNDLCNAHGECVFVPEGDALECGEPTPCDGIACGDACYLDGGEQSMPDGSQGGAPDPDQPEGDRDELPRPAPMGLCDSRGTCVPASEPVDLMCDEDRCEPGGLFDSADGCNTCVCPDSGIRAEAACDEAVCQPDPGCEDRICGDRCEPEAAPGAMPAPPSDGDADELPSPISICDINLRCVRDNLHEGCGM
jgi:hypothetical protein